MRLPPGPDWSQFASRAEAQMKKVSDCMLAREYDTAVDHMGEVQHQINGLVGWILAWQRVNKP